MWSHLSLAAVTLMLRSTTAGFFLLVNPIWCSAFVLPPDSGQTKAFGSTAPKTNSCLKSLLADNHEMVPDDTCTGTNKEMVWTASFRQTYHDDGVDDFVDISQDRGTEMVVDLRKIESNYDVIKERTGREVIGVVKARAYGSGLVPVSAALADKGCDVFAVATLGAGISLRQELEEKLSLHPRIIVLGYTPPEGLGKAAEYDISLTLVDDRVIWKMYVATATRLGLGANDKKIPFHVNLDTGMTRVGVPAEDVDRCLKAFEALDNTSWSFVEGVYTHMSRADTDRSNSANAADVTFTLGQMSKFETVVEYVAENHKVPMMVHVSNSPSISQYPETYNYHRITHVRPGALLHGMSMENDADNYQRASQWQTTIVRVEKLDKSTTVGYGQGFVAEVGQTIGTLPVGYADGYMPAQKKEDTDTDDESELATTNCNCREPAPILKENENVVLVDGVQAPVVAHAMDMVMVLLDDYINEKGHPPVPGKAKVMLLNDQLPPNALSAECVAQRWGVSWAIALSNIRTRNTRVYIGNNEDHVVNQLVDKSM